MDHIISKERVKLDPERMEAISKVPLPASKKSLQSFLGQTNFVHRFIPNYAEIMKPIYKLLKKDVKFVWNEESKQVFERCREFGISLNPAKSVFGVTEGKLLGHIISKDGVKLEPES